MAHETGTINKVVRQGTKSIGFGSFFGALWKFLAFGVLSALPYVITNLNEVGEKLTTGSTVWVFLWSLFKALSSSVWTGMVIAGATIWDSLVHYQEVFGGFQIGTWLYLLVVVPALLFTVYQPVKIIANILDNEPGENFNPILAFAIAIIVTLAAAAVCFYAGDGRTITSSLQQTDTGQETPPVQALPDAAENITMNETIAEQPSQVNSFNLLTPG